MSHKIHIIIVIGMACLIYLAYSLVVRFQAYDRSGDIPESSVVDETIYIQFEKASFGLNCDGRIMDMSIGQRLGVESYSKGGYTRYSVKENNAREALSKYCGRTKLCRIIADEATLGFDPAPRCDKKLHASYRCFNFDILRQAESAYGGEMLIDCNAAAK